jgi:hypothetical protein
MSNRISLNREEVDRMILLGMDADRYQTQVIPDLLQRVSDLARGLKDLVEAVAVEGKNGGLSRQLQGASARAEKILAAGLLPTNGGKP